MWREAGRLWSLAHKALLTSTKRPLRERRGHIRPSGLAVSVLPLRLVASGKTGHIYLSHLEVPLAAASRVSAFCRGYWGRGTPCPPGEPHQQPRCPDVEKAPGPSDWAPGCCALPAVHCPWTRAAGRRLVPWGHCPRQCCSHCVRLGHCALQDTAGPIRTTKAATPQAAAPPLRTPRPSTRSGKGLGRHTPLRMGSSTFLGCRFISSPDNAGPIKNPT